MFKRVFMVMIMATLLGIFPFVFGQSQNARIAGTQPELKRPQTPAKPYPYKDEEVTFENREAGITLAGTFTRPEQGAPFPAVILIHGSGNLDRDETLQGHKPFLVLADHLTRRGFAVLRYDKRGVGTSQGSRGAATVELATDAMAAFAYLKTRADVRKNQIGMIGHSEGGAIAPMCAAQVKDVAFLVLLAGPGLPGKDILMGQLEAFPRAEGTPEEEIKKNLELNVEILNILASAAEADEASAKMRDVLEKNSYFKTEQERKNPGLQKEAVKTNIRVMLMPAYRAWVKFDSRTYLEHVTVPVLALNGEKDLWVNPKRNLPEIEASLRKAGNQKFRVLELPGLNHAFQHAKTGTMAEIRMIEETIAPEVLGLIADWIAEILK